MAQNFVFSVVGDEDVVILDATSPGNTLQNIVRHLRSIVGGGRAGSGVVHMTGKADQASVTCTLNSFSGTLGLNINGVAFSVTGSVSTAATAAAIQALIAASVDPLVQPLITSSVSGNVITITAKSMGVSATNVLAIGSWTIPSDGTGQLKVSSIVTEFFY